MAWSFVNAGTGGASNNSNPVAALPASTQTNDLLVILAYGRGVSPNPGKSPDLPGGWSEAARYEDTDGSRGRVALFYKIHDGSEADVTVTFSGTGATGSTNLARMMAFRGNATSSPIGDVGADSNWAAIQNIGPVTAVTLTTADQLLLVCSGRQQDMGTNGDSSQVSVLSGDSQTWAEAFEYGSTLGQDAGAVVGYAFTIGTPTITDKTFTNANTQTAAGCGFMVAFKILSSTTYPQAIAATSTFTPAVTRVITFTKTLAATSTFTATLTQVLVFARTLAATSTFAPAMVRTVGLTLTVASTFSVAMVKQVSKTLAVASVFAPEMVKGMFKTLEIASSFSVTLATALLSSVTLAVASTFTAGLTRAVTIVKAIAATSAFLVSLAAQFIAGGGGGEGGGHHHIRIRQFLSRWF